MMPHRYQRKSRLCRGVRDAFFLHPFRDCNIARPRDVCSERPLFGKAQWIDLGDRRFRLPSCLQWSGAEFEFEI